MIDSTISECPASTFTWAFVLMSHSLTVESLPPVASKFRDGWSARANTPLRCPWYYLTTLFYSRSQHFTCLSSPHEKRNGWRLSTSRPLTVLIWPVRVTLSCPEARSQNLIVLSFEPDTKNLFIGSIARHLTHPLWPLITVLSFQGACHFGSMTLRCLSTIWF